MNQYPFNGSTSLHSNNDHQPLTPVSDLTTQQFNQQSPSHPQVLPPLHVPPNLHTQQHHYSYSHGSSLPQTPRVPSTPVTPGTMDHHRLPQLAPQPAYNISFSNGNTHTSYTSMGNGYSTAPATNAYAPIQQQHQSAGNVNQTTGGHFPNQSFVFPQGAALAYPPQHHPQQSLIHQPLDQKQTSEIAADGLEDRPVPVVGSQGRRGILPSAVGPPAPGSMPDAVIKGAAIPNKNADNKYPCLYCNKTYLHLKHLKRHHLRRKWMNRPPWPSHH